ncbi:MAG: hypothetical protein ACPGQQ_02890 [Candidatus Puniceispirillaceae bacterium]
MRVLIACEYSAIVRDAFRRRGHDAWSCDLLPTEGDPQWHFEGDVMGVIYMEGPWDLMIAHPPCTYLTASAEWAYKDEQKKNMKQGTLFGAERRQAREEAIEFFMDLANAPIEKIAIENPIGVMSTRWREPDQFIQPYEYGEDASKRTCLWLKNLPRLKPTGLCMPRLALSKDGRSHVMRWGNQTDSGQNKLPPSEDRGHLRSATYHGWAEAMAEQWGDA